MRDASFAYLFYLLDLLSISGSRIGKSHLCQQLPTNVSPWWNQEWAKWLLRISPKLVNINASGGTVKLSDCLLLKCSALEWNPKKHLLENNRTVQTKTIVGGSSWFIHISDMGSIVPSWNIKHLTSPSRSRTSRDKSRQSLRRKRRRSGDRSCHLHPRRKARTARQLCGSYGCAGGNVALQDV